MTPEEKEAQAKGRFMMLNVIRLVALAMVMMGIANALGKFLPDLAPWFGYLFIALGMFEFFFLPKIVARGWRSNDESLM